jgi:hypothetical protein
MNKITSITLIAITLILISTNNLAYYHADDPQEQKNCVIQEYRELSTHRFAAITTIHGKWSDIRETCDLSYTQVKQYQNSLGMRLEKLRD